MALAIGVLVLSACADDSGSRATGPAPPPPATRNIPVTGTDDLRFEPDSLTVPISEEVTLTFSAETGIEHDFVVEDAADVGMAEVDDAAHSSEDDDGHADGGDLHVAHADPGQTTTATFHINDPGTYTVYCSIPGHRQAGMLATLTAVESS